MADINATPLVDVMLVLLVMLIITIPVQWRALTLDLPGDAPPPPVAPVIVQLDLMPAGWAWNGEWLDGRTALTARLAQAAAARPQPELHLWVDPATGHDRLVATLADAQRAGVQKIGLVGSAW